MTKPLTQKDLVAIFVRYQPNCDIKDVAEALDMASTTACKHLRALSNEGIIIRNHSGTQYSYTAEPSADIPDEVLPCMEQKSDPVKILAAETKAKELENRGFWRRAATVYTDLMAIACSSIEVARFAQCREKCLRQARRA